MIDSTIIRAHACAAGLKKESQSSEALGRSKGGFTTKIHAVVDGLGNPLRFQLTPGQRQDITQAPDMIKDFSQSKILADKGYDAKSLIEQLQQQNCEAVIPPKKNRKEQRFYDMESYKERHLIECFFGKLKYYRRVFSRFEKSASAFMSFLCFAGALIWLR
jgi:transposase